MAALHDTFGLDALRSELGLDEGVKARLYDDLTGQPIEKGVFVRGNPTIGIGHNLSAKPLTQNQIDLIFQDDVTDVCNDLDKHLAWWRNLDKTRQRVLINMCFNLGISGLLTFSHTIAAIQTGNYAQAAQAMRESTWHKQVGSRADRLIAAMEGGSAVA